MAEFEPRLKEEICPVERVVYNTEGSTILPPYDQQNGPSLATILENRRSIREFEYIDLSTVGRLLYLSSRTKQTRLSEDGLLIEKRNSPSSGALHTIDCIISSFEDSKWYVYNPRKHTLDLLVANHIADLEKFKEDCRLMLPGVKTGVLIWYVCDIKRLEGKYSNIESLALRESGALSGIQSLIAEDLGLAFCMLGRTGYKVAQVLSDERDLIGVGAAILGNRPPT